MENSITQISDSIPELIKKSTLNITLQGWPAAVTAIAFFGSCIAIYAIKNASLDPTYVLDITHASKIDA